MDRKYREISAQIYERLQIRYANRPTEQEEFIRCFRECVIQFGIIKSLDERDVLRNVKLNGVPVFDPIQRAACSLHRIRKKHRKSLSSILCQKKGVDSDVTTCVEKTILATESLITTKARFLKTRTDKLENVGENAQRMANWAAMIYTTVYSSVHAANAPGETCEGLLRLYADLGGKLISVGVYEDQQLEKGLGAACAECADAIDRALEESAKTPFRTLSEGQQESLRQMAVAMRPGGQKKGWFRWLVEVVGVNILINII